ncbi:DUF2079 domain-containing protein [Planctomicrobium sp. SH661]|uniref:DUF2079 domain-containing protein n=1 Tax=Planctomicrobium sp. SH661 TaxID=3448124 RepID=UPI003F5AEC28
MPRPKAATGPASPVPVTVDSSSPLLTIGSVLAQWIVTALFALFVLENEVVARTFVSLPTWTTIFKTLGGTLEQTPQGLLAVASLGSLTVLSLCSCLLINFIAALSEFRHAGGKKKEQSPTKSKLRSGLAPNRAGLFTAFAHKSFMNALWSIPIGVWAFGWLISILIPGAGLTALLVQTVKITLAATLAGWLWEILREWGPTTSSTPRESAALSSRFACAAVLGGMLVYLVIFVGMNWGLWFNLQLPHGDSSMYEEHLWNVLHGKGFRSYLDQGLFWGEHIQFVHLLLLPLYFFWPSHLFMELSESAVLALGAVPVYWIARRHGRSERAAMWLSLAYLLYFPMHYLDIAIDLKTFRPSAFGIPALLFMIDAAERRRWGWMSVCILVALSCQEDFGVAIAPFGLWLFAEAWWNWKSTKDAAWKPQLVAGLLLTILAPLYVIFAVKFAIPWFHEGKTVHYASYFQAFGKTPVEIVVNILTNPALLWKHLVTAASTALFLDLLMPVGMPLREWRRLLVGLPLFVLLCLNELTKDFPGPFHHFHAALIPIILWGAGASLMSKSSEDSKFRSIADQRGLWMFCCALTTGLFFSLSPWGIQFWDSGSPFYWQRLYVPGERAREFAKVLPLIPPTARVASTDFVHPRFTHFERSYDYSHYPRRVADYEDKVPDDTDYIVIDTGHRYSEIQRFDQTREYRNQRDQWEEIPVDTKGYFIVLKRVKYPDGKSPPGQE